MWLQIVYSKWAQYQEQNGQLLIVNRDPLFQVNLQVSQTKSGEWRCSGVVAGRVPPATAP